ncbi:MAG: hypothetical protein J6Q65_08300 [Lentisphaeria bacterium]|nr:hypothetical protein [Lentisphaeria bacterium]
MSQLRMILDTAEFSVAEPVVAEGYRLTRRGPEYAEIYCRLRNRAGWGNPDQTPEEFLADQQKFLVDHVLPEGLIIC